jgi:hypothetical protein
MTESVERKQQRSAGPAPPAIDPAEGVQQIKLRPHEMTDAVTAADDLFVLAHLGIPRIDATQWSLTIDGMVGSTVAP